jgi:hypothetical protein
VPELPHVQTQSKRLERVESAARDALAHSLEIDPESFDLTVEVDLPLEAKGIVADARELSKTARVASKRSGTALREASTVLVDGLGLTVRDAASLLGVSFQRVAQVTGPRTHASSNGRTEQSNGTVVLPPPRNR